MKTPECLLQNSHDVTIIGTLTFSFDEKIISNVFNEQYLPLDLLAECIELILSDIFGFTLGMKKGSCKFYEVSFQIGSKKNYRAIHFGGGRQNSTICIEVNGNGCIAAKTGWHKRLLNFLQSQWCERPKIIRIDLALDLFGGEYSPDQALDNFNAGLFNTRGKQPKCQQVGTDWLSHDNSGKTLYLGTRKSQYFVRIYEKGKQLGNKNGKWPRFELQISGKKKRNSTRSFNITR